MGEGRENVVYVLRIDGEDTAVPCLCMHGLGIRPTHQQMATFRNLAERSRF